MKNSSVVLLFCLVGGLLHINMHGQQRSLQRSLSSRSLSDNAERHEVASPTFSDISSGSLDSLARSLELSPKTLEAVIAAEQKIDDDEQKTMVYSGTITIELPAVTALEVDAPETPATARRLSISAASTVTIPATDSEEQHASMQHNAAQQVIPIPQPLPVPPQAVGTRKKIALHAMRWAPAVVTAGIAAYGITHVRTVQKETLAKQQDAIRVQREIHQKTVSAQRWGNATSAAITLIGILCKVLI